MPPCAADYTRKRTGIFYHDQEKTQMPILISSLGPKRRMVGLSQGTITIKTPIKFNSHYSITIL